MIRTDDPRTLDLAREVLRDIDELDHVEYRIAHLNAPPPEGLPTLILVFDYPEAVTCPALAIGLVALSTGSPFSDDRLRRVIRNGTEQYLKKIGVQRPALSVT